MVRKKAKKRSQAPVALVYFITLIMALGLVGGAAYYFLNKFDIFKKNDNSSQGEGTRSLNLLLARVSQTGEFKDLCVLGIDSERKQIIIVPQPAVTKTANGKQYKEVMAESGIDGLERAVSQALGISIDYHGTITDSAFEQVVDIMGGMTYTAEQELYHISQNSARDDISIEKGDRVTLNSRQIRNIMDYDIFNNKKEGNLQFLGLAIGEVINNGFRQADMLKDNLKNIYDIITKDSDNNITKEAFNKIKDNISKILETGDIPAKVMQPQGFWNNDYSSYTMKNEFTASVGNEFGVRPSENSAVTTKPTEPQ